MSTNTEPVEIKAAKLSGRSALVVALISALTVGLITAPVTIWVANKESQSATEQAEAEFLRTQRQAAYAELLTELWKVDRVVQDCTQFYEINAEVDPPGEAELGEAAESAGTDSSLREAMAIMVASPATSKIVTDISTIRYDAVEHCYKAMVEVDPVNYPAHAAQLREDYSKLSSLIGDFLMAAQDDVGNPN